MAFRKGPLYFTPLLTYALDLNLLRWKLLYPARQARQLSLPPFCHSLLDALHP